MELVREGLVLGDGVEGDAEDLDAVLLEVADSITEPAALLGSTRGVGLGIEPEHDAATLELLQSHRPPVLVLYFEVGCDVVALQHGSPSLAEDLAPKVSQHRGPSSRV
jgi:hypothetical protein